MQLKKIFTFVCFSLISFCAFSQTIKAEKDLLCKVPLGYGENEVYYYSNEEFEYKPDGLYINPDGEIVFCYIMVSENNEGQRFRTSSSCSFVNNEFIVSLRDRFYNYSCGQMIGQNSSGYCLFCSGSVYRYIDGGFSELELSGFKKPGNGNNIEYIPVEKGLIVDSTFENDYPSIIGVEIVDGKQVRVINMYELNEWLKSQKGNFEVRSDGYLYKNGFLYSDIVTNEELFRVIARLPSGHCVHTKNEAGSRIIPCFVITRPDGTVELEIDIPWKANRSKQEGQDYDWSFGNYGELYALLTPPLNQADTPGNFTKGNAELVCVRNYLKYFGVLTDDRIRLRSEPTTSSESLGTYPINTGFRILEKGTKQETIGGDTGVWYKVRLLDGKEGWFFGAYVRDLYDGPGTPLPWPNVADWN